VSPSRKQVHQSAAVVWEGSIARGGGTVTGASKALGPLFVDLPNRLGQAHDKTTPEELLAAAHATCFTTALGSVLAGQRTPPDRLEVKATVSLDLSAERPTISLIELDATGEVPGADDASFAEALQEAERRCLISRVLREGTTIRAAGRLA
jgi:osmotically inducible protein OsmC